MIHPPSEVLMPSPLPVALRERVLETIRIDSLSIAAAAARFLIGTATVKRWLRRVRETGTLEPAQMGGVRVLRIGEEDGPKVRDLVEETPDATLAELTEVYNERHGTSVSKSAMVRALARLDITRKKRLSSPHSDRAPVSATRAMPSRTSRW